jgi:sugar diacid utilization regulator
VSDGAEVLRTDRAEALRTIAQRIVAREDQLARSIVEQIRRDIVNYRLVEGEPEFDEAVAFIRQNLDALVTGLTGGEAISQPLLQDARRRAQGLVSQGVSLSALHHSGRVWGSATWQAVLEAASPDDPEEREAALEIGTRIWRHVDVVCTTAALAYLDEVNDRGLLGRELLDALLAGRGESEFSHRLAHSLHIRLGESHVVVLIRGDGVPIEDASMPALASRVTLDRIVEAARNHLRPAAGSLLLGIRQGDLVALYPVSDPEDVHRVRADCQELAAGLHVDVSIGMSGWHLGLEGIGLGYVEAREAVEIAAAAGIRGRPIAMEDVLVEHMLRSSPHAQRMLHALLRPLLEYDGQRHAELVETLRAYLATNANLTQSAKLLTVNPNTVVYRLQRIRQLTGRDPRIVDELLVLYLALKVKELSGPP